MTHNEPEKSWKANNCRDTKSLAKWTTAWVVTMAIANFGPKFIWQENELLTLLAIVVNLAVGVGMILANKRHLAGLDELQQRIQLNAMAGSLGVGLIVGLSYSNLDVTGLIGFDAEISHLVIIMALTYMVGILLGNRKYQ
ncbi:hypothetical protein L2735_08650 [Shewanella olleyana]|uniref:hypothetical protein n=1 Tax=Shewanella olleyana TaxID=135626 RepID=UPI00200E2980|nr:hypothetical protein [Shewanella olleyana]MCL1066873.1 hypothetical protein [Shewanella olleyana]